MARASRGKPRRAHSIVNPMDQFCVSLARDASFKGEGLRPFFVYRDLGINEATGGRVGAHVIRANRPCVEGTGRHLHRLDFQLVYLLKGRAKFWYEGQGEFTLGPGDCVHQPPGIAHELVECSADLEMLEITLPAEFATIELPAAAVTDPRTSGRKRARAGRAGASRPRAKAA